jgi:predicted transcriptional regulator
MMREAITQYVEREERKEAFRRDTLDAWQEFQETGLHVSLEEADQWLAGWGTEIEGGAPACHK